MCTHIKRSYHPLSPFLSIERPEVSSNMASLLDSVIAYTLDSWLYVLLIVLFSHFASNYFYHGLQRYPGPFLAKITNWWRFVVVYGRQAQITHIKLHRKHGDIVRLGPDTLSFADPKALKTIYGLNKGFIKVH